jgi:hypothetical protein
MSPENEIQEKSHYLLLIVIAKNHLLYFILQLPKQLARLFNYHVYLQELQFFCSNLSRDFLY